MSWGTPQSCWVAGLKLKWWSITSCGWYFSYRTHCHQPLEGYHSNGFQEKWAHSGKRCLPRAVNNRDAHTQPWCASGTTVLSWKYWCTCFFRGTWVWSSDAVMVQGLLCPNQEGDIEHYNNCSTLHVHRAGKNVGTQWDKYGNIYEPAQNYESA